MSYNWKNYYDIANCLKNNLAIGITLDETRFRCAVSRYYYSLHNLIKIELENKLQKDLSSYSQNIKGSHKLLIDLLYSSNDRNVRYIGSELDELKEMREDSDYRVSSYKRTDGDFKTAAELAFIKADELIKIMNIIADPSNNIDQSILI